MNTKLLDGKKAVVVGFQSDIINEISELFKYQGADVFCLDKMDFEKVTSVVQEADILVYVPGLFDFSAFCEHSEESLNKPVYDSLSLLTKLMRFYINGMMNKRHGRIVNVIYDYTDNAVPGVSAHALYSGAVKSLTKAIAMDYCKYDIRANCIMSGFNIGAQGKYWKDNLNKEKEFVDYQPIKRLGTASDIANAALFLASDMSSFISGESIPVNGGAFAIGHNQAWSDWLKRI